MELIDSHTHLDAEQFAEDLPEVLERARGVGVRRLVSIGAGGGGFNSAENAIALAEKYDFIWATAGVHPHDAQVDLDLEKLRELASHSRVVAIGETGLDFYRDWCPREQQESWFRAQIELALEMNLPLVIHSREAGAECLQFLTDMGAAKVGGVFHCYAEDAEFAKNLRDINFLVSFPGSVTFKNADALRETVREIPLEQIMVETDAPYLAPEPYRGKRCESAFVVETAKKIAEVKEIELEEFASVVTKTTVDFYRL